MKLPNEVLYIINKLNENNFKAYAVGGCVRDLYIEKEPHDYDITTEATPEQVKNIFKNEKIFDTGIKYGTITLVLNNENYEITTFRKDIGYSDGRRPDKIQYGKTVYEDLSRRDFTMNAICFDGKEIIDPFNGIKNIKDKKIKTVGKPIDRFLEDGLRVFRAYRFSAQLGWELSNEIRNAIKYNKNNSKFIETLNKISKERIREELIKILLSNNAKNVLMMMREDGILSYISYDFEKSYRIAQNNIYHYTNVFEHSLDVVSVVPCKLELRIAALLHDLGKIDTCFIGEDGYEHFYNHSIYSVERSRKILNDLKFSNIIKNKVLDLVQYHDHPLESKMSIKRLIGKIGIETCEELMELKYADIVSHERKYIRRLLERWFTAKKWIEEIKNENEALTIKDLKINGKDIMEICEIKQGKKVGEKLNEIFELVINGELENKFEKIKSFLLKEGESSENFNRNGTK